VAALLLAAAGCRSDKTPELERVWQLGGVELRAPAWRPVLRDGDPSGGVLRLRPRQVPQLLGMSLRWDALAAAAVKDPAGQQAAALAAGEALRGHFIGELRLPPEMVQAAIAPPGGPRQVQGHDAHALELKVAESQVGVSAFTWYCPQTARQLMFEVHHEGRADLRRKLAAQVLETVRCHGPGSSPASVGPVPMTLPSGWSRPEAAGAIPAGFTVLDGPDGQRVLVGPPRPVAERRGSDPEVARREAAWAFFPALQAVHIDSVTDAASGPAGHPAVKLAGTARRPDGQKERLVALRWDCPHRRRTMVAAVTWPDGAASGPTAEAALALLNGVRCHGE
jgi:hypothetical protein